MKSLIVFAIICISLNSQAQVTIYDEESNNTETSNTPYKKSSSNYYKLKIDFEDALAVGTGMIYGEKSFSDKLGLEVGVGITYISLVNYYAFSLPNSGSSASSSIYSMFLGEAESTNINGVSINDVTYPDVSMMKFKPGFAISVFPKLYLEDDPTEGFFFGVQAQFKNYNFSTPSGNNSSLMLSQSLNKLNLSLNIGNGINFSDHFMTETFMGLGVSLSSDVRNAYNRISGGYQDVKVTYSPTRLHYQVGARLSYIF